MKINKKDYNKLCDIAQKLCDIEHEDYEYSVFELWKELNGIINNIKE